MGGAGHAESAEEERHQRHQAEVVAEPGQGVGEVVAVVLDGPDPESLLPERQPVALGNRLGAGRVRQLDEELVFDPGAELEQLGGGEVDGGDEDPGPERRGHPDIAGDVAGGGVDDETPLAEGQGIADPGVEGGEQGRIDHGFATASEGRPPTGGLRDDRTVERVARLDGLDLNQSDSLGPSHVRHAGKTRDPRGLAAAAGGVARDQGVDQPLDPFRERLPSPDREVGAEEGLGLGADRGPEVFGEPVDGHQRGHPRGH